MSLSYQPLTPIRIQDPITELDSVKSYAVLSGGDEITFKNFTSTSISNSSIQFSCPPSSSNVIVDRLQQVTIPMRLTFTGRVFTTNNVYQPNTSLLNSGYDCPRAFPLNSILDTIQASINNTSFSMNNSDIIHPLLRYNTGIKLKAGEYSMTPAMQDMSNNYSDLQGTSRNPLNPYGEGYSNNCEPRGAFPFNVLANAAVVPTVAGTAATSTVDLVVTEPLFLSPFYWGCQCGNSEGFYGVNTMDFNFSFLSGNNAGFRAWSHSNAAVSTNGVNSVTTVIDSIQVSFNDFSPAFSVSNQPSIPQMLFKYISPNPLNMRGITPNKPLTYPYSNILRFPTDIGVLTNSQGVRQFQTNNIQLNQIPRRIYVFARPSNAQLQSSAVFTDTYLAIHSVSVQFGNSPTLLSTASQQQLYMTSLKNGLNQSWNEWSGAPLYNDALTGQTGTAQYSGGCGPLCLELSTDIQLKPSECAGMLGQYQIQLTVGLRNANVSGAWDAVPMTLYLLVVNEGTFTILGSNSAQAQLGVVSERDVILAREMPGLNYRDIRSVEGGDFMSGISDFANKFHDFLKQSKVLSIAADYIPLVGKPASKLIENLGYGMEGGVALQGRGGCAGGKKMNKAQLRRSLMDY